MVTVGDVIEILKEVIPLVQLIQPVTLVTENAGDIAPGAPLPHPLDVSRTPEVVFIFRFIQPVALTFLLACLSAFRFSAKFLSFFITRIRMEKRVSVFRMNLNKFSLNFSRTIEKNMEFGLVSDFFELRLKLGY